MAVEQIEGDDAMVMRLSQTFIGEDVAEQFHLASEALAEGDTATSVISFLEITENEDEIVYKLSLSVEASEESADVVPLPTLEPLIINRTPFPGPPDFSDPDANGRA
jgi:hypothetical protein